MITPIYTADINGGHYAILTIPPGGSEVLVLNSGSYNNVQVTPVRLYVSNYNNAANVSITLQGGIETLLPAYQNGYITILGYQSAKIMNPGDAAIKMMVVDEKMVPFAENTFATVAADSANSPNAVLNHFDYLLSKNEGFESDIIYTVGTNVNLSGQAKFGDTCANFKSGHGGITLEKQDFFDLSGDYTIDFWFYGTISNTPFIFAAYDQGQPVQQMGRIGITSAGALRVYDKTLTPAASASAVITANTWQHIALVKEGATSLVFVDGVQRIATGLTGANYDRMILGRGAAGNVAICRIDEFRFFPGSAMWTTAFTPPTEPYK